MVKRSLNVENEGNSAGRVNLAEQKPQVFMLKGGQEGGDGTCHLMKA